MFAYRSAVCHLKAGSKLEWQKGTCTPEELRERGLTACLEDIHAVFFEAYTLYTTHADNLCFFVESDAWSNRTSMLIADLSMTVSSTVRELSSLIDLTEAQSLIVREQLRISNEGILQTLALSRNLSSSAEVLLQLQGDLQGGVNSSLAEVRELVEEVEGISFKMASLSSLTANIHLLRSALMGTSYYLETALFWGGMLLFLYLFLQIERVRGARFQLYVATIFFLLLEMRISSMAFPPQQDETRSSSFFSPVWATLASVAEWIYGTFVGLSIDAVEGAGGDGGSSAKQAFQLHCIRWLLRGIFAAYASTVLFYTYVTYLDALGISNELLRKISAQSGHTLKIVKKLVTLKRAAGGQPACDADALQPTALPHLSTDSVTSSYNLRKRGRSSIQKRKT